jgi:hypothetical protein
MKRSFCLLFVFFIFAADGFIYAEDDQTTEGEAMHGFRRRALLLEIDARILEVIPGAVSDINTDAVWEEKQEIVWNEIHNRTTIPGSPVGLKLVGSNIVVSLQFTPFVRRHGSVLVAQGQIFINDPDGGMSYYTSIQTIPMEFGEPIYFFPLGSSQQLDSSIEIILTVSRQAANTEDED